MQLDSNLYEMVQILITPSSTVYVVVLIDANSPRLSKEQEVILLNKLKFLARYLVIALHAGPYSLAEEWNRFIIPGE